MAVRLCPVCGTSIPGDSAFCPACGSRIPARWKYRFVRPYVFPRFQIDPTEPQPQRDIRWPALLLGFSFLVTGGVLLAVDAVVAAAAGRSAVGCGVALGASGCGTPLFEWLFLVPGFALLGVGAVPVIAVLRELW